MTGIVREITVTPDMVNANDGCYSFAMALGLFTQQGAVRTNVRLVGTLGSAEPDYTNWFEPWKVTFNDGRTVFGASAYDAAKRILGMPRGWLGVV